MKYGKKWLHICLAAMMVVLCLSAMPVESEAATVASGYCGMVYYHIPDSHKTHTWTLDDSGTLTISGEGWMGDYNTTPTPWAKYQDQIVSVVIQPGTTYIGHCSFENCKNLKRVEFPESLTEYGDYVFNNCDSLTDISFVKCFSSIGRRMFGDCDGLVNITVPEGVTVIGDEAFLNCKNLTSVVLPKGVKSIANSFNGCSKLKTINLPEGLTKIGFGAFYGCSSLESIVIPDTVKVFEGNFTNCSSLKTIKFPAGITSIPNDCFSGCSSLEEIVIPDTVKTIGEFAFSGCAGAKTVKIPASTQAIGNDAFLGCDSLIKFEVEENNARYCDVDGVLYTKDLKTLIAYPAQKAQVKFVVPSSVTKITKGAFWCCGKLEEIELPQGLEQIEEEVFYGCEKLKHVKIPQSVQSIGNEAFWGCWALESIVVDENNNAYCDIEGVLYTKSLKRLVVYPAGSLRKELVIPDSVSNISAGAFMDCHNLERVELPKGLKSVPEMLFSGCKKLKVVVVKEGVTSIQSKAFAGCSKLEAVVLPVSLKKTDAAFEKCFALRTRCYTGTDEQWEAIQIHEDDYYLRTAKNHSWREAVHDKPAGCEYCGAVKEVSYGKHKPKDIPGKEATCTEDGMSLGQVCEECGEVLLAQTVIPAKGHTLTHFAKKDASYEADGNLEHWTCICGKWFADEQCASEITDHLSVVLAKLIKVVMTETVVQDAVTQAGTAETVTLPVVQETPDETVHGVEIPVVSLEAVVEVEKSVSIETTQATVVFDKAAQEAIVGGAGEETSIVLEVKSLETTELNQKQQESVKEKDVQLVISAQILCNENKISDFKGGKATVHIPFEVPKGEKGSHYKVIFIADDGTVEELDTAYENGKLVVELAHFSEYAVVKAAAEAAGASGGWILWAGIGAAVVAVVAAVIVILRKKKVAV